MLECGCQILIAGDPDGEFGPIICKHEYGFAVPAGDADMLATTILDLAADPARCAEMGRRSRAMLDEKYSRRHAFERWLALLEKVAAAEAGATSTI